MPRKNRPWTTNEMQYLRDNYGKRAIPIDEIGRALSRSKKSVYLMAHRMELTRYKPKPKKAGMQGVPMVAVLSPDQCKAMRLFLSTLLRAHEKNPDLDVGVFMSVYRKHIAGREALLYDVI